MKGKKMAKALKEIDSQGEFVLDELEAENKRTKEEAEAREKEELKEKKKEEMPDRLEKAMSAGRGLGMMDATLSWRNADYALKTVALAKMMTSIKKSGKYLHIPGIKTWDSFLNKYFTKSVVLECLQDYRVLGERFLSAVADISLTRNDFRMLRKEIKEGNLQIAGNVIDIEGEMIPLDEEHKDCLQEAIEKMKNKIKKEASAKNRALEDINKTQVEEMKDLVSECDKRDAKLRELGIVSFRREEVEPAEKLLKDAEKLMNLADTKIRLIRRDKIDDELEFKIGAFVRSFEDRERSLREHWFGDNF